MSNDRSVMSPDLLYTKNLATVAAALELGGSVLCAVTGGEEASNLIGGKIQEKDDFQQLLAARLQSKLGV